MYYMIGAEWNYRFLGGSWPFFGVNGGTRTPPETIEIPSSSNRVEGSAGNASSVGAGSQQPITERFHADALPPPETV